MHDLRRSIIGKIGGFAAICAILLLSLAPVASQTLEHARIESLLAAVCASDGQGPQNAQNSHHAQHGIADHLQACAYCDLIAHAPTPPTSLHRDSFAFPPRDVFAAAPPIDAPRRALPGAAQPRAPPAFA
ncbi:hypothetical protein BTHE68_11300 [Burkholderia sp. THE68]|uniref:DUF2946 domain-containing protein n=1 Tax=Burkholderia sp. THE68 TaxID=758782 RepID=UPI001316AB6B|nr:DUF2946 domain-containing protein [Burkholderia sp. THE68]BBU27396.1 hypothetical protein BTHE68_11300 [Burkholderia sp. THE68]